VGKGLGEAGEGFGREHGEDELAACQLGETRVGAGEVLGFEGDDHDVGGAQQIGQVGGEADSGAGGEGGGGGPAPPSTATSAGAAARVASRPSTMAEAMRPAPRNAIWRDMEPRLNPPGGRGQIPNAVTRGSGENCLTPPAFDGVGEGGDDAAAGAVLEGEFAAHVA